MRDSLRSNHVRMSKRSHLVEHSSYEAFKAVDRRQLRLAIRTTNGEWSRVPYSYLLDIVEDGSYGTIICLIYSFKVVKIIGRRLTPIADAIEEERCQFVREFDSAYWQQPTDESLPFIESISIYARAADELHGSVGQNDTQRH